MATTTPKPSDSREKRLQHRGQTLLALTPQQGEQAAKIAAKLLVVRAKKKS